MKIAIVASDYAPTVGGVQTAVRNIAHYAARQGHDVIILSALPSGRVPATERVDDVMVYRFRWGRRPTWSLPFRAAQSLFLMRRVLIEFKPDLVYIHFLTINALYVLLLHYWMGFKFVASARGNDIQGIPLRSRLSRWMLYRLLHRANAVLFCSSYVQRAAAPFLEGISSQTYVGVVGDGFEASEFDGAASRPFEYPAPFLLGMGRLVEKKGFDMLIDAFGRIADEFPRVHLLIAGDGEERDLLEALIRKLCLQERIKLLGFTDRKTTIGLFLGCEFFVLSSRIEPFGIVVLEAMAANKPVLATRSGGVIDLVRPGVNGQLVEPNADDLGRGMREMLAHPETTRLLGEKAAETIQNHTWASVTEQYLAVFGQVLRKPGSSNKAVL